jgi:SOS-response transcriptional repressor LexA
MSRSTPSREILDRLIEAGVPKGAVAKKLVLAPSAISALFAGERQLKHDEAVKLLEMLPRENRTHEVPLIGMAGAGNWIEAVEVAGRQIPVPAGMAGRFALEIVGSSMNLLLPDGSIAIVDPDDTSLYVGKIYLLLNDEGEATVKRYRTEPSRFEPVSDDPSHTPFEIGSSSFRVIGRISGGVQFF